MALDGNRLFLGGFFRGPRRRVAPAGPARHEVPGGAQRRDGQARRRPDLRPQRRPRRHRRGDGRVADGKRLYVGGRFSHIGGGVGPAGRRPRPADRPARPQFDPPVPDEDVRSMALSGGRLFIGGEFLARSARRRSPAWPRSTPTTAASSPAGTRRRTTAAALKKSATKRERSQGAVYAIAVTDGGKTLMVGGTFMHLGHTVSEDPKGNRFSGLIAAQHLRRPPVVVEAPQQPAGVRDGDLTQRRHRLHRRRGERRLDRGVPPGDRAAGVDRAGRRRRPRHHRHRQAGLRRRPLRRRGAQPQRRMPQAHPDQLREERDPPPPPGRLRHERASPMPKWTAQADTAEGPTCLLAGPKGLYVGRQLPEHPARSRSSTAARGSPIPGFAMFPPPV